MGLNAVVGKRRDQYNPDPIRYADMRPGCYDPAERAKDMLADGIYASVLFPTLPRFAGTLFPTFKDLALADASVRAYNDFVIEEWCPGGPPGMFVPTIISQLWDPQLGAAEIRRCAELGARALSFPENPVPLGLPSYWTDHWNPVWQACQDHDVVLCLHIGTSGETPHPSPEAPEMLTFSMLQVGSIMSSLNLMMSPVCRNYPGLKFVFSEGGIGWLPNALERADRMWIRHQVYSGLDHVLPSEIFRQNMFLCMIEEPVCLKYRDDIGIEHIMWECDYPHTDTTWPDSQSTTQEVLKAAGVSDEESDLITHGNAERVFGWKMAS
jgi:predicted TIM-barrel fold metal-dependent hydrolase